jgi:flagella basal body P-ring formation protein FlgA
MPLLLLLLLLAPLARGEAERCIDVSADRIVAADVAPVMPEFGALAPDTVLGLAPVPGVRRQFSQADVARLLSRFDLAGEARALCFEYAVRELAAEELEAAIRRAATGTRPELQLNVRILDWSRHPVPEGRVEFSPAQLSAPRPNPADGSVVLRGRILYSERRTVPIWVRAHIETEAPCVAAKEAIAPRVRIEQAQLALTRCRFFPWGEQPVRRLEDAAGGLSRRAARPGEVLFQSWIEAPWLIERGQKVTVRVARGLAVLHFEAEAENRGREGDTIFVKSPFDGRRLAALVKGRGQASIPN